MYTNSGRTTEWHSYQERHLVDTIVTDALGRPAWRIFRSLRALNGSGAWMPAGTFVATVTAGTYELQEDNMRSIRLSTPVREGATWRGNRFLGADPYNNLYAFDNDNNIADWDFTVTGVNQDLTVNGKTYSGVASVDIVNEQLLPDTIDVSGSSVQIPTGSKLVWLRGNSTANTITLTPPVTPPPGRLLSVYNFTNRPVVLNGIETLPTLGRNYEYYNNSWTYGNGEDTTTAYLPFGFRSFAREQYARGVGLIAQEYVLYEFQP
ncbi:MAG: hypothetical protein EOO12_16210, partial [Chitinophagaceae bacterium]